MEDKEGGEKLTNEGGFPSGEIGVEEFDFENTPVEEPERSFEDDDTPKEMTGDTSIDFLNDIDINDIPGTSSSINSMEDTVEKSIDELIDGIPLEKDHLDEEKEGEEEKKQDAVVVESEVSNIHLDDILTPVPGENQGEVEYPVKPSDVSEPDETKKEPDVSIEDILTPLPGGSDGEDLYPMKPKSSSDDDDDESSDGDEKNDESSDEEEDSEDVSEMTSDEDKDESSADKSSDGDDSKTNDEDQTKPDTPSILMEDILTPLPNENDDVEIKYPEHPLEEDDEEPAREEEEKEKVLVGGKGEEDYVVEVGKKEQETLKVEEPERPPIEDHTKEEDLKSMKNTPVIEEKKVGIEELEVVNKDLIEVKRKYRLAIEIVKKLKEKVNEKGEEEARYAEEKNASKAELEVVNKDLMDMKRKYGLACEIVKKLKNKVINLKETRDANLKSVTLLKTKVVKRMKRMKDKRGVLKKQLKEKEKEKERLIESTNQLRLKKEASEKERVELLEKVKTLEEGAKGEKQVLLDKIKSMEEGAKGEKEVLLEKIKAMEEGARGEKEVLLGKIKSLEDGEDEEKQKLVEKVKLLETVEEEKKNLLEKVKTLEENGEEERKKLEGKIKILEESGEGEKKVLSEKIKSVEKVEEEKERLLENMKKLEEEVNLQKESFASGEKEWKLEKERQESEIHSANAKVLELEKNLEMMGGERKILIEKQMMGEARLREESERLRRVQQEVSILRELERTKAFSAPVSVIQKKKTMVTEVEEVEGEGEIEVEVNQRFQKQPIPIPHFSQPTPQVQQFQPIQHQMYQQHPQQQFQPIQHFQQPLKQIPRGRFQQQQQQQQQQFQPIQQQQQQFQQVDLPEISLDDLGFGDITYDVSETYYDAPPIYMAPPPEYGHEQRNFTEEEILEWRRRVKAEEEKKSRIDLGPLDEQERRIYQKKWDEEERIRKKEEKKIVREEKRIEREKKRAANAEKKRLKLLKKLEKKNKKKTGDMPMVDQPIMVDKNDGVFFDSAHSITHFSKMLSEKEGEDEKTLPGTSEEVISIEDELGGKGVEEAGEEKQLDDGELGVKKDEEEGERGVYRDRDDKFVDEEIRIGLLLKSRLDRKNWSEEKKSRLTKYFTCVTCIIAMLLVTFFCLGALLLLAVLTFTPTGWILYPIISLIVLTCGLFIVLLISTIISTCIFLGGPIVEGACILCAACVVLPLLCLLSILFLPCILIFGWVWVLVTGIMLCSGGCNC